MKYKRFLSVLFVMFILILGVTAAIADEILPYASEEINSSSVTLLATKKIVYNVSLTQPIYNVKVNYCKLYRQTDAGRWVFLGDLTYAIPKEKTGNLHAAYDLSRDIDVSGTYQVRVSITSGNTTVYHSPTRTY